jgi:hypothetical protein
MLKMQPILDMDEAEFEDFRQSAILSMIRRYYEMFPSMPRKGALSIQKHRWHPQQQRPVSMQKRKEVQMLLRPIGGCLLSGTGCGELAEHGASADSQGRGNFVRTK